MHPSPSANLSSKMSMGGRSGRNKELETGVNNSEDIVVKSDQDTPRRLSSEHFKKNKNISVDKICNY